MRVVEKEKEDKMNQMRQLKRDIGVLNNGFLLSEKLMKEEVKKLIRYCVVKF